MRTVHVTVSVSIIIHAPYSRNGKLAVTDSPATAAITDSSTITRDWISGA